MNSIAANNDLRKDLSEKIIEIGVFEEENNSVCQKLDILKKDNAELSNKVRELQQQLEESADVVKQDVSNQTSLHRSSVSQQAPIKEEQECLNAKCRQNQIEMLEKMDQLECLTNSIKLQREVINKINTENENLKEEIDTLNNRNKTETERLQELVNHSQNQVAVLLKEHDEKTAQFQSVAHELDNIRTSVTQDNDNLMGQITQLQQENESIQKENELINICQCEEAQNEIDSLYHAMSTRPSELIALSNYEPKARSAF
ncbi:hypothetical protein HUJ04_012059 [Dendroctonus ponderosae]|nr:hypothetical protein HUJ04_012059 [Dendroctonus ponderosae]